MFCVNVIQRILSLHPKFLTRVQEYFDKKSKTGKNFEGEPSEKEEKGKKRKKRRRIGNRKEETILFLFPCLS